MPLLFRNFQGTSADKVKQPDLANYNQKIATTLTEEKENANAFLYFVKNHVY